MIIVARWFLWFLRWLLSFWIGSVHAKVFWIISPNPFYQISNLAQQFWSDERPVLTWLFPIRTLFELFWLLAFIHPSILHPVIWFHTNMFLNPPKPWSSMMLWLLNKTCRAGAAGSAAVDPNDLQTLRKTLDEEFQLWKTVFPFMDFKTNSETGTP